MPKQTIPAVDMYPSLNELLEAYSATPIPPQLIQDLFQRYNAHGMEYATELRQPDGKIINRCMLNDSVQDAREELTDAIFNLLVCCLKKDTAILEKEIHSWRPRAALAYAIKAWALITP